MGNNVCGPLPGPSPQGSCHWLKLWGQECETDAFRQLPDLNQPHRHETELLIENRIIAKWQGIHLSVPEILISFLKKKPHIWPKRKVEKMYCWTNIQDSCSECLKWWTAWKKKCLWQIVSRLYLGVQSQGPCQLSSHSPSVFPCLFITIHTFTHKKCSGHLT